MPGPQVHNGSRSGTSGVRDTVSARTSDHAEELSTVSGKFSSWVANAATIPGSRSVERWRQHNHGQDRNTCGIAAGSADARRETVIPMHQVNCSSESRHTITLGTSHSTAVGAP